MKDENNIIPTELSTVGKYNWPMGPKAETARHLIRRYVKKLFKPSPEQAVSEIEIEAYKQGFLGDYEKDLLDDVFFSIFNRGYEIWLQEKHIERRLDVVIHMPSAPISIIKRWAKLKNIRIESLHSIIQDDRDKDAPVIVNISGGSDFLRTVNGVKQLAANIDLLSRRQGAVLLICNSFTWRYLRQATAIDYAATGIKCFPPFDALAIAQLLERYRSTYDLRSAHSRNSIVEKNNKGELVDDYLQTLAARSLGCPWAALEMISSSARNTKNKGEKPKILYLSLPEIIELPVGYEHETLFLLHSLLIHDGLTFNEIKQTIPYESNFTILIGLEKDGIISFDGQHYRISRKAYSDCRSELRSANFPVDQL